MKQPKVIVKNILFTLFMILFLSILIYTQVNVIRFFKKDSFADRFKDAWDVTLPSDYELIFSAKEESFHGDGYHYYILYLDAEDEDTQTFLSQFHSVVSQDAVDFHTEAAHTLLINAKDRFSFIPEYVWALKKDDYSTLYMLYNPQTCELCLVGYRI